MQTIKVKNPKVEFAIILLIGGAVFTAGLLFLLLMYRPFVPWQEMWFENDPWKTGEIGTYYVEWVDNDATKSTVHYFYEVDGIKYEKVYKASVSHHSYGAK